MDRFFERLAFWIERTLAVAFMAAVALSFVNVVGRYILGATFIWADEVQIYIMIWMAFLGAVVVSWRRMHLRMDLLFKMLPARLRLWVSMLERATTIVLAGVVLYLSGQYAYTMFALDRLSDVAQVPMWIPHSGVALGFGLMLLIALWHLWQVFYPAEHEPHAGGERNP
jgi:TRAP-type C4-dicarboxylate transport system permease small subunit